MNLSDKTEGIEIYNKLFKGKEFRLPQSKHERPIIESEIETRKDPETGEIKKVEVNEYGTCLECGYPLVALDRHHAERVCECGVTNKKVILLHDTDIKQQQSSEKLRSSKDTGYTDDEIRFLKSRKKKVPQTRTPKTDWRKSQYYLTLGNISSQLMMTKIQKDKVKEIIDQHSLHMIHSRVDARTTIAGICRYILKQDGRGRELQYNKSAFKFVGLNKSNYDVIERNLKRIGI